jgi:hypothetical protein
MRQSVRRVRQDLRKDFSFARVQRSLGTKDQRVALSAALELDREWHRRFSALRLAFSLTRCRRKSAGLTQQPGHKVQAAKFHASGYKRSGCMTVPAFPARRVYGRTARQELPETGQFYRSMIS